VKTPWRALARWRRIDPESVVKAQLPTVIMFVIATVAALALGLPSHEIVMLGISIAVMAMATVLAFYLTRRKHLARFVLVVPALSLIAIALFRDATGGPTSVFTSLLVLPVLWFGAQERRRWIFVGVIGSCAGLMLPYFIDANLPANASEWVRGGFVPLVFLFAAAVVHEQSRRMRRQIASIENLAAERGLILKDTMLFAEKLKENEARLHSANRLTRSVLDSVTEQSVIGTDLTGLIDVWNPGASMMLGLSADETQGSRYIFQFHVAEELETRSRELNYPAGATVLNPGFSALVESARLGDADVRDWTYRRDDGTTITVSLAVTPRVDEEGEIVGYIFVATDVTQALEVARMKDEFVGLISHELRTPLSSILGYLELLRDDDEAPLSEEQLQYLGVAERNAHRLLRLVGDLLFTAQVSSGKFPLDLTAVTLNDVVSAATQSAAPVASAAGVDVILVASDGLVSVHGDAVRLGQACDNLISNAIKFTPKGGSVTVTLSSTPENAIITVRDTGMGIPADELDKLYARFFRASTATRNAVPGVGLGLTITKAIVTAHEGTLDVESEVGVGTTFILSLPLHSQASAAEPQSAVKVTTA
jgi:signal transduction histidine kinase